MNITKILKGGVIFDVSLEIRVPYEVKEEELRRAILHALETMEVKKKKKSGEIVDFTDQVTLESMDVEESCTDWGLDDDEVREYEYDDTFDASAIMRKD